MADVKISGLPASTVPLTGAEVLPIVQGGVTKQVSVANLNAFPSVTFASLPTASTVSGHIYLVSDRGSNGTLFRSTGTIWVPLNPYILYNIGIPFIYPPGYTMGNNGALSAAAASVPLSAANLPTYTYFYANQIFSGSTAGWYYTIWTNNTTATVYNNTYTSGVPVIPASPTPFVSTGPGAVTQTTGIIYGLSLTVPGKTLGANSSMLVMSSIYGFSGGGTHNSTISFAGTFSVGGYYIGLSGTQLSAMFSGNGVTPGNASNGMNQSSPVTTSAGLNVGAGTVNLDTDQTLTQSLRMNSNVDYAIIAGFTVTINY
jgi:hypothetical protein